MDGPQDDLIEQIMRASLEKQSALRDEAPAGDAPPDVPDPESNPPDTQNPEEAPPEAREQPPPKPEPPKAGKALTGLTAALAVAAALLLIMCLVQFKANENTVAGLRDAAADIQAIDELRTENQQLQQELDELQRELASVQNKLILSHSMETYLEYFNILRQSQDSGMWACLVAREIFAAGDHEGSAATLKVLLNNIGHLPDMPSSIRGKDYSLWEMMTEMVEELRAEGYLSQEEADSLNDKFSDIKITDAVLYG